MADENINPGPLPKGGLLANVTTSQAFTQRRSVLRSEFNQYQDEYRQISDHFQARRGRYFVSQNGKARKPAVDVLHEEGMFASRVLGAGMLAGVSSPARPWLKITTPDSNLNQFKTVRAWLDIAEARIYQMFGGSNYYHVKQQSFRDMGDFGQGPVIMDEDFEDAINCYCAPVGEYLMAVDHRGVVDTLYRDMQKTALQIVAKFGLQSCPREVQDAYARGDYATPFDITHVCEPNIYRVDGELGPRGMPYMNAYYCPGVSTVGGNDIIQVRGYNENPISAPRWEVQPNDVYGHGCGTLALKACKSLQALEKRSGQIVDKLADPALQGPASLEKVVINKAPGKMSYYPDNLAQGGARDPISPIYKPDPGVLTVLGNEDQRITARINRAYYVDLFLQLSQSTRREITAREIEERHEEKLIQLGPVLERTHYEGLNREVKRAFGVASRHGLIPPPPKEMDGLPLKIEYTSILAVAQRAVGVGALERLSGFIGNLSAGNPAVLDKFDMDQTVDEYAEAIGVPAIVVRSDEDVDKIRQDRAKQQQAQQQMAMAAQGADTAAVLSQADTGRDSNLLADILGGSGRLV